MHGEIRNRACTNRGTSIWAYPPLKRDFEGRFEPLLKALGNLWFQSNCCFGRPGCTFREVWKTSKAFEDEPCMQSLNISERGAWKWRTWTSGTSSEHSRGNVQEKMKVSIGRSKITVSEPEPGQRQKYFSASGAWKWAFSSQGLENAEQHFGHMIQNEWASLSEVPKISFKSFNIDWWDRIATWVFLNTCS